jgi:hypothetical protein
MALAIFSPGKLGQEVALPVSWGDANSFRWVMVWGAALWVAAVSAALYPWADLESFRINCSAWMYASIPGFGGGTAIYPSGYPLFALLTGPGLILVLAAIPWVSGACLSWWLRLWFWRLGGVQRERASAVSGYLMAWWGGCGLLFSCDVAYRFLTSYIAGYESLCIGILALLHVIVLGRGCVAVYICLKQATRCSATKLAAATFGMLVGGIGLILLCALAVDYGLGVVALIGESLR